MKILLSGATGKMGAEIITAISNDDEIIYKIDSSTEYPTLPQNLDIAIDFSSPSGTERLLKFAQIHKIPLIIGTTGLNENIINNIKETAKVTKIVYANNFSIGVNVLYDLIARATELLPVEFQTDIIETHHKYKKDAPSGTAKELINIISNKKHIENIHYGRHGFVESERSNYDLGVHSIRCGNISGEHKIIFAGEDEILTLEHRASSRKIFAKGALLAAKWLLQHHSQTGLFSMSDVCS